ncbi:MAG TPA: thiolase family protein [Bacillota bacterium]|nr:thiolase family protein [Bacillota bacterium]
MPEALISAALRTPVGRQRGALAGIRPDDLAAGVIRAVVTRTGVPAGELDDVILGCANQAGEDNRNVARMAALLAGLPVEVPGATVNRLCASGLDAVMRAFHAIRAGEGDAFIAGGVESMSRAPLVLEKPDEAYPRGNRTVWDTTLGWRMSNPAFPYPTEAMGETAENVAARYGIGRQAQDGFALESQRRWAAAAAAGRWADEVVPVEVTSGRRGEVTKVVTDEHPRPDATLEALTRLRPAFKAGGTVTAGNSSGINDGAAALLIVSEDRARTWGLTPLARIVATGAAGVEPSYMGMGPVPATRKALRRAGWSASDLDLVELNEAFAAQSLACIGELGLDPARVNVNGGAIAIGHPLGCSGARILTTLVHEMKRRGARRGLATLCIGVGQGLAMLVEAV